MYMFQYQAVAEMPEYIKQANKFMDEVSRESFINYIAQNPLDGDLIPETGGARKIRWTSNQHQGKRGGARIIYYFYNLNMPIFLLTAYAKNEKANITNEEKKALKTIVKLITKIYGVKHHE